MKFEYICHEPKGEFINIVCNPLPEDIAESILLNESCHVDHEGFDLNKIEQEYYKFNGLSLTQDSTWYKDGGKSNGTNAILQPWIEQYTNTTDLIIDHSHFVFKYQIVDKAAEQILKYSDKRPELLRLLSTSYKCGLDLCIDYINREYKVVEPVVHIEWDFDNFIDLKNSAYEVKMLLDSEYWKICLPSILNFNRLAKAKKIDAFAQADVRSMLLFGSKSYKLIPTL